MDNNNQIYHISVAEPWDFESPDGKNIINGIILSVVNNSLLIFKSNYTLNFDGITGDILILSPRFEDADFQYLTDKDIEVNGGLYLYNYANVFEEKNIKEYSKFVIIGTIISNK